ncbi:helix-turn-helix transcriptional regulator [Thalassoglobus neptunius]
MDSRVAAELTFQLDLLRIARRVCVRSSRVQLLTEDNSSCLTVRHTRIASDAAELIETSLDGLISIAAIAQSLDVSERTLLTAFRSRYHQSPRHFIQSMRLNRARTLLRDSPNSGALIQDIAAQVGFYDAGRFASKYQRLFGELPSQTVKNT